MSGAQLQPETALTGRKRERRYLDVPARVGGNSFTFLSEPEAVEPAQPVHSGEGDHSVLNQEGVKQQVTLMRLQDKRQENTAQKIQKKEIAN